MNEVNISFSTTHGKTNGYNYYFSAIKIENRTKELIKLYLDQEMFPRNITVNISYDLILQLFVNFLKKLKCC